MSDIPTLVRFSQLYWNEMGRDVYGSIEDALREMLNDGGDDIQQSLRTELMLVSKGGEYGRWFAEARSDIATIRKIGGRFILPKEVPLLLAVLEEWSGRKAS